MIQNFASGSAELNYKEKVREKKMIHLLNIEKVLADGKI